MLTLDRRDELDSYIPGDQGDAYLVLSLLQWGADRSTSLFIGFWEGPIFAGFGDAMAYSETFLLVAPPFKLIEWVTGSPVIAFNALYVLGWILCAEATYALAKRLLVSRSAALVVATAFTFSTVRVAGSNHFQLTWAGLIPITFIALHRFWEHPSARRGAVLALAVLAQMLSSAYYGVVVLVAVGVSVAIGFATEFVRQRSTRQLPGTATFYIVAGLPMLYLQHQYTSAAERVVARPEYPAPFATRLGDLRSPMPTTRFLDSIGFLSAESANRTPENHAYVGAFVLLGIPLLVALAVTRRHTIRDRLSPMRDWAVIVVTGVVCFGIALGRTTFLGVQSPVYDLAGILIPGIGNMVAIGRLVVFTQFALVLCSGAALTWTLARVRARSVRIGVAALLMTVVVLEAAADHPMVYVVRPEPGSANAMLETLAPGNVVLLPVVPVSAGILQPFTEGPRMVLGANDDLRSVNGYSGYTPNGYADAVDVLNRFPEPSSIQLLRQLDVQVVVIYTSGIDIPTTDVDDAVNASGLAFWSPDDAEQRLSAVPEGLIAERHDTADGIVLELTPVP